MKKLSLLVIFATVLFCWSCQTEKSISPGEGFVHLKDGKVWYRIVGEGDKPHCCCYMVDLEPHLIT